MGCRSRPIPWPGAHRCPRGGYVWAASPTASSPAHPSRTAAMSACITRCRRRTHTLPPAPGVLSSSRLIASARSATASVRTRRSTGTHRPRATHPHPVRCPTDGHRLNTPTASRCATSAPMGAFGGIARGCTSRSPVLVHTSASTRSTLACGTSTAARSSWIDCWNDTCESRTPMVDSSDTGNPCPRTFLLLISPAGHSFWSPRSAVGKNDRQAS
jgi:hypothetical protein